MKILKAVFLAVLLSSPAVQGATLFSQTFSIAPGAASVGFLSFDLLTDTVIDIGTSGPTLDPQMFLFQGTANFGASLFNNDDACQAIDCGVAGSAANALLDDISLVAGSYTLAVSDFPFDEAEAVSGMNAGVGTGDILVLVGDNNLIIPGTGTGDGTAALVQFAGAGGPPSGLTPGEEEVLDVILDTCPTATGEFLAACDALELVPPGEQTAALNSIIPNSIANQGTAAVELSTNLQQGVTQRLLALRQGPTRGIALAGLTLRSKGKKVPVGEMLDALVNGLGGSAGDSIFDTGRLGVFINGRVDFGDKDSTRNETGFDFDRYGVTAGADYRFNDSMVAGAAIGYATSESDFDGNSGDLDTDYINLSLYGTYYLPKNFYVDAIASYGSNDYDSTRNIVFTGFSGTAKGDTDGDQISLGISVGMDRYYDSTQVSPYGRIELTKVEVDGYSETGGGGLGTSIEDQTIRSVTSALGVRVSHSISKNWGILTPGAHLEWLHQYSDDDRSVSATFLGQDPATGTFQVFTDDPDRDYFNLGVSLVAAFSKGYSAFMRYETPLGLEDLTSNTVEFGMRMEF